MTMKASLTALSLLLASVAAWPQGGGPPPANVRIAMAEMASMTPVTQVPGTVISRNDARLSAEVSGRLLMVADIGTEVVAGDPVARIEDTALQLRNAELAAEIQRTQSRVRFLVAEEKRFESLAASNLAAATQLEQTRSDLGVAEAELQVARVRLRQNEDLLARTALRSPFDGVVVERLAMAGENVDIGDEVVRVVDPNLLEVVARAPLDYYGFVARGAAVDITDRMGDARATVRTRVAVGDENTHLFELRLDLEGAPYPVGKTVRVAIPVAVAREVLAVPRDALVLRPDSIRVFVIDDANQAQPVEVVPGIGSGDQVEVSGALSPGDRVVVRGNERLQQGQSVNVLDNQPAT